MNKLHTEFLRFAELLEGRGIEAKVVERPGSPLMLVAKPGGKVHVRLIDGFVVEVDHGRGTPRVEAEFAKTLGGAERLFAEMVAKYRVLGRGARSNPVGRGALTSDEDRLKSFARRMRKEGFVVRAGIDSLEIHATADDYVIFTLLLNQRFNVQRMHRGDTASNESLANYWLAEERAAFLARSLRDGQAAAMRAKKTDARYRVPLPNPTSTKTLERRVQRVLTPDLLEKKYRAKNAANPMYGHCYAASDAMYHLLGGKAAGYTPMVGVDPSGIKHWWLRGPKGEIIDVTAAQYTSVGKKPPYAAGKGCGFSSRKDASGKQKPGDRAIEIMRRVRAKHEAR